jgi:hypothetical protein
MRFWVDCHIDRETYRIAPPSLQGGLVMRGQLFSVDFIAARQGCPVPHFGSKMAAGLA